MKKSSIESLVAFMQLLHLIFEEYAPTSFATMKENSSSPIYFPSKLYSDMYLIANSA